MDYYLAFVDNCFASAFQKSVVSIIVGHMIRACLQFKTVRLLVSRVSVFEQKNITDISAIDCVFTSVKIRHKPQKL